MAPDTAASVKQKISLEFKDLPAFAGYVLHYELDDFIKALIRHYEATDIPLLRFFKFMNDDRLLALATGSAREMLTMLAAGDADAYVEQSISSWIGNQLPVITREQVQSQDITLVNYVRAKVFRQFIPRYTSDSAVHLNLIEELERLTVILNSELFSSYIELQNQQINDMNTALKKREQQLLEAQEIGQVGSFEWDLTGTESSCTSQVYRIFEMHEPGDLPSFMSDVHPDDRDKLQKTLEASFLDGDFECEYRYLKNNREKVIFSRGKVQFNDGNPVRMIGTVTDVTERHAIIKRLEESEKLHKQAQALTHIGNWSWFVHENKIFWSDEMYRIYGLEPQSESITYERFISFIHPDDRPHRIAEIQRSLETLEVEEYHFRIVAADGATKVLKGKGEVRPDDNNKAVVLLGTCQDVTKEFSLTRQLKERERYLEELNQSLQAANHALSRTNEELESFNFIASHDLQEPLRKIQVYSSRILESGLSDLPATLQDYFTRINNASSRMQKLIEDFLSFSQTFNNPPPQEEVNMNQILEEIRFELGTRVEEKQATIEVGSLPSITGVPFQLKQLMTNLISNALKYADPTTAPHIVVTGSVVSGIEINSGGADPNMSYTKISVSDNGIGFDPKYAAKIFELFQRLHSKNAYSGTGIGLALCRKIVRNMNGLISAHSTPGRGATFTFYLPIIKQTSDQLRK